MFSSSSSFLFESNNDLNFIDTEEDRDDLLIFQNSLTTKQELEKEEKLTFFEEDKFYFDDILEKDKKCSIEEVLNDDCNETKLTLLSEGDCQIEDKKLNEVHVQQIFQIKKIKKKKNFKRKPKKNKIQRKNDSDNIRRKIKPNFHKYILDLLNQKIKKKKLFKNKIKKFLKMNNHVTSTVSINYNKKLIKKKIGSILYKERISSKYKNFDKLNNKKLIKFILAQNDLEIRSLLNKTYKEMYYQYLSSDEYKNFLYNIKIKDGDIYMNKFYQISLEFIDYFEFTSSCLEKAENQIKGEVPKTIEKEIPQSTFLDQYNFGVSCEQSTNFTNLVLNINMPSDGLNNSDMEIDDFV